MLSPWERKKAAMKLGQLETGSGLGGGDTGVILDASIGQGSSIG